MFGTKKETILTPSPSPLADSQKFQNAKLKNGAISQTANSPVVETPTERDERVSHLDLLRTVHHPIVQGLQSDAFRTTDTDQILIHLSIPTVLHEIEMTITLLQNVPDHPLLHVNLKDLF